MQNTLPFKVGTQSSSAVYAPLLGQKFFDGVTEKWYRLVKAAGTLTNNNVVTTAYTASVATWNVNTTTTANDTAVVGCVSGYSGGVTSGNYFLMQISGAFTPLFGNTTLTITTSINTLGTATTAGAVQSIGSLTAQYDTGAAIGWATNTAVVTAIGQAGIAYIAGLLAKA